MKFVKEDIFLIIYTNDNTKDELLAGMNDITIPEGWKMDVGSLRNVEEKENQLW